MLSGAALFANAISTSRAIMYSLSGGYLGLCARSAPASKVASRKTRLIVSFFISDNLLIEIALACSVTPRDDGEHTQSKLSRRVIRRGRRTSLRHGLSSSAAPGLAEF